VTFSRATFDHCKEKSTYVAEYQQGTVYLDTRFKTSDSKGIFYTIPQTRRMDLLLKLKNTAWQSFKNM
jgi:hypothetical protein